MKISKFVVIATLLAGTSLANAQFNSFKELKLGKLTQKTESEQSGAGCSVIDKKGSSTTLIGQWNSPKGDWFNINGKDIAIQNTANSKEQNIGVSRYKYQGTMITLTATPQVAKTGSGKGDLRMESPSGKTSRTVYISCGE